MIHSRTSSLLSMGALAAMYVGCANENQRVYDATDVDPYVADKARTWSHTREKPRAEQRDGVATRATTTSDRSSKRTPRTPDASVRPEETERVRTAFTSANGYDVRGEAEFTQLSDGVEVRVAVVGATPGLTGVHIHQNADCSDIPNRSMGAHFSPPPEEASYPTTTEKLSELGPMQIGADGAGELKVIVPAANLKPDDSHSLLTRSIVLHETSKADQAQRGQPQKPIACGIIDR